MLTDFQRAEIEAAARPMLRKALRHGMLIGIAIGAVAMLIVFAMTH